LFSTSLRAGALEDWYKLLPANTLGVIAVKNTPELVDDWNAGSFGRLLEDEEFKRWTAPMMKEGEAPWNAFFKETTGEGLADTLKRYPGASLAVFVADTPEELAKGLPFVALSEAGGKLQELREMKDRERELAAARDGELKARAIELAGVEVNVLSKSDDDEILWDSGHAFVGEVLVEGNSRKLMEQMIASLKSGAAEASPVVVSHLTRLDALAGGTPDLRVYLNGEVLMRWIVEAAHKAGAEFGQNNPMPISPNQVIGALGLEQLQAIAFMLDLGEQHSHLDFAMLHAEKPAGLLALLRTEATGPIEMPGFVPAEVISGSSARFSMVELWDDLFALLGKLGPVTAMATAQLGMIEGQVGVKLRDDLFASLGDEYVEITDGDVNAQSQVVAFKVRDLKRLGGALEGVRRFVGAGFAAFEESEFLGQTIYSVKTPAETDENAGFAFCLTDSHLLLNTGRQTLLKTVLTRMKDSSGPSLWDGEQARELLGLLPAGYMGVSVTDSSRVMKLMVEAATLAQTQMAGALQQKAKGPKSGAADAAGSGLFDLSSPPSEAMWARYFGQGVGAAYQPADAMHYRMLTRPVKAP
jgi:hypothetical protein